MRVQINGEPHELHEDMNLSELIAQLELAPERLAVERNREVVRRAHWAETKLADGDQIEIVHFVGGGSTSAALLFVASAHGDAVTFTAARSAAPTILETRVGRQA